MKPPSALDEVLSDDAREALDWLEPTELLESLELAGPQESLELNDLEDSLDDTELADPSDDTELDVDASPLDEEDDVTCLTTAVSYVAGMTRLDGPATAS